MADYQDYGHNSVKTMKQRIAVFGLGYVGTVTGACLSKAGHTVIGVDPNGVKVDSINAGASPVIEEGLEALVRQSVAEGRLSATTDAMAALAASDLSIVCVGTPSRSNGSIDLRYIESVCEQIGSALPLLERRHVVVIRSTVLPGTMHGTVLPVLEASSGMKATEHYGVVNNPEFLREGTAIRDFNNPPKTVLGETDKMSGDLVASLYAHLDAPLIREDMATVEMIKYVDNVWHALKVTFGNEVGRVCKAVGVDSHRVMDVFCQDRVLNISPAYLYPGAPFGGSCLPKDVRALSHLAGRLDVETPTISSVLPSNAEHLQQCFNEIARCPSKKVGILGLSFKAGTDDLRESPIVELVERLIGKGYDVRIYDRNVSLAKVVGANRDYIINKIPHISELLVPSAEDAIDHGGTIVIGNKSDEFSRLEGSALAGKYIVDLVRQYTTESEANYRGLCW